MGFLSEIKKVLFGAKAVSKSAAEKAADYGKEKGGDFLESADDLLDYGKEKGGDLGSSMMEKGGDLFGKAKDVAGDLTSSVSEKAGDFFSGAKDTAGKIGDQLGENPMVQKAGSVAEDVGGKILETGSNLAEKAGSVAENVGGKIIDASSPYVEKAGDVAENVGGVILDKGSDAIDKAKDFGNSMMEKTNDLMEKANAEAAKESLDSQIDKAKSWSDKLEDHVKGDNVLDQKDPKIGYDNLNKSLIDDKDDFWSKAEKYADGDYSGTGKNIPPTPPTPEPDVDNNDIFANTAERQKALEEAAEKEPFKGEIKGYTDTDGDGDPLIDDAIIDED